MSELTNIERRRIQAEVIRPIYEELKQRLGKAEARALLARAVTRSAEQEAAAAAARAPGRQTSMEGFTAIFERTYVAHGASAGLEAEVLSAGPDHLHFDVTRCHFVEMYRQMGLGEIADVLSCNRDGVFAQAYDTRITLDRAQTIAEGAPRCTFRYSFDASS